MNKAYKEINALSVPQRYTLVGGQLLEIYNPNNKHTENTCAMQISYMLNKNGMFIENYISQRVSKQPAGVKDDFVLVGSDKHNYIVRVETLIKLFQLENFWGHADEPYNPKEMTTKQENINFYNNEFSKFDKSGVVAMIISGWNNAGGHITLWDGANELNKIFLDYDENLYNNYLLYGNAIVTALYFWELK
ncbi:hypothetical protein CQA53_06650 [Helicobacter didelphidarum]|uniref:Type VI secretion system amidase effector protein Tae4 n=2 Tax=Helicobacter didelphidarum TaxID=2040648 RepID=A0A3D8IIZ5_9HELI|nr:T6SS effector amidase Tae4 family protein [Helicobacter didelphidarum]RDU65297.1 hypothetical protein CQA53_06650 [Helicobacter didelphidarum]